MDSTSTMMIVVVGISLMALGLALLRRTSFWGGQATFVLGVFAIFAAIPQLMTFSQTVIYGLANGVSAFIAQF